MKNPWRPAAIRVLLVVPLVVVLLALDGGLLRAEPDIADWPQFRGPRRDGISTETGLLKEWPDGGPQVVWRRALGEGYSGLSVVGPRLFTMFSSGGDEIVIALDVATGTEIWRYRSDSRYKNWQGSGPRSTPTVEGGVVYILGAQGHLAALNAEDGSTIWAQDLQQTLGARPPQWGVSGSPLVEGRLLLLDAGGKPDASLVALDKTNGDVVWITESDKAGYSSPIAITLGGRRQILFFTGTQLVAVSPESGDVLWKVPWKTSYDVNAATPVFIAPDKVFVASGYDTGAALLRIRSADGKPTVEEIWRSRGMKNQFSSSIYHDGSIYGFDNTTLKCVDVGTGEERWRARGFGHGSLTYADGHLLVLGVRGKLALVEATPSEYREKASAQVLEGKCWTVPTLAGGRLFLRNEKEILALDMTG